MVRNPYNRFISALKELKQKFGIITLNNLPDFFHFSDRLSIAKDYELEESVCRMIEKLYPEDKDIFDQYDPTI